MPLLTNRLQFWGYQQKQTKTVVGPYYDSPKKRVLKMEIRGAPYWAVQGLSKKLGLFLSCRMHFKLPGLALVVQIVQYFWCDYCPCHQCHPGTMAGSEFPRWLTTKDVQQLQVIFIDFSFKTSPQNRLSSASGKFQMNFLFWGAFFSGLFCRPPGPRFREFLLIIWRPQVSRNLTSGSRFPTKATLMSVEGELFHGWQLPSLKLT